jgi:hypothetical protein
VFTPISVCLGVLSILPFLQAGLASGFPVPAGALTPPFVEGEVDDVELLFLRFTCYVEEKLASVLNLHARLQSAGALPALG